MSLEDNSFPEIQGSPIFVSSLWTETFWFTILSVQILSNSTKENKVRGGTKPVSCANGSY